VRVTPSKYPHPAAALEQLQAALVASPASLHCHRFAAQALAEKNIDSVLDGERKGFARRKISFVAPRLSPRGPAAPSWAVGLGKDGDGDGFSGMASDGDHAYAASAESKESAGEREEREREAPPARGGAGEGRGGGQHVVVRGHALRELLVAQQRGYDEWGLDH